MSDTERSQTTGRQKPDGSWTVPGLWRPDEVHRRTGIAIPEGPAYETVAGFVMSELGRVPEVGDFVESDGWRIVVIDMEARRVDRLRFTPIERAGADATESRDEDGGPRPDRGTVLSPGPARHAFFVLADFSAISARRSQL